MKPAARLLIPMLVLMFVAAPLGAKEAAPLAADPAIEARLSVMAQDLRCLVCQNQSLADSNAPLAEDLRREIREQMHQGKNDRQVIDFLVERYGDFVLYKPPFKAATLVLWIGPFLLLLLGIAVLMKLVKKRPSTAPAENEPGADAQAKAKKLLDDD